MQIHASYTHRMMSRRDFFFNILAMYNKYMQYVLSKPPLSRDYRRAREKFLYDRNFSQNFCVYDTYKTLDIS